MLLCRELAGMDVIGFHGLSVSGRESGLLSSVVVCGDGEENIS